MDLKVFTFILFLIVFFSFEKCCFSKEDNKFLSDQIKILESELKTHGQAETKDLFPDFRSETLLNDVASGKGIVDYSALLNRVSSIFFAELMLTFRLGVKLVASIFIISFIGSLKSSFNESKISDIAYFCGYIIMAVMLYDVIQMGLFMTRQVVENSFSLVYSSFPLLIMFMASSGNIASAGVIKPFFIFSFTLLFTLLKDFLLPLVFFQVGIAFVSNFTNKINLSQMGSFIKQITLWSMGIFLTLFSGILSLQGSLGYSVDGMTARTAKLAIVSGIPFAGRYMADASETIVGYSLMLKNSAGFMIMIALLSICAIPVIKMIVWCLFFKVLAVVGSIMPDTRFSSLLNDVAGIFFLMVAIIASILIMVYVMIAFIVSRGVG